MENIRSKYTANFKRDYVAWSAVILFLLLVASEITLAVSLPLYMKKESAMAVSVRRLTLLESFDATRRTARSLNVKDETAKAEVALLRWNLDRMAEYLRLYSKYISANDIATLQQQLNEMNASLTQLQKGVPFSEEYKLDYTPYLERVMKQSGAVR